MVGPAVVYYGEMRRDTAPHFFGLWAAYKKRFGLLISRRKATLWKTWFHDFQTQKLKFIIQKQKDSPEFKQIITFSIVFFLFAPRCFKEILNHKIFSCEVPHFLGGGSGRTFSFTALFLNITEKTGMVNLTVRFSVMKSW